VNRAVPVPRPGEYGPGNAPRATPLSLSVTRGSGTAPLRGLPEGSERGQRTGPVNSNSGAPAWYPTSMVTESRASVGTLNT
jgi:hypothetical protein